MKTKPEVSVVIIGRNEGDRLIRCIHSVQAMHYPSEKYEIIYVDSYSNDNSLKNAIEAGVDAALCIDEAFPTAARGRNRGLKEAQGDFVLFLDGDTLLNPDFLRIALPVFQDERIAIVFGYRTERDKSSIFIRLCDLDWRKTPGFSQTAAGDILARRKTIVSIGGYNGALIAGEDPEMSNRIINAGYKIMKLDCEMVTHDLGIQTFTQYWKFVTRGGYAYAAVANATKYRDIPLWRKESLRNWLQGIFYVGLLPFSVLLTLVGHSCFYLLLFPVLFSFAILRTMYKNRVRISDLRINALYSLHSHFIKIPMLFGQIKFVFGKRSQIIEYR